MHADAKIHLKLVKSGSVVDPRVESLVKVSYEKPECGLTGELLLLHTSFHLLIWGKGESLGHSYVDNLEEIKPWELCRCSAREQYQGSKPEAVVPVDVSQTTRWSSKCDTTGPGKQSSTLTHPGYFSTQQHQLGSLDSWHVYLGNTSTWYNYYIHSTEINDLLLWFRDERPHK